MNDGLVGVWERMLNLGLGALAHANRHAAYFGGENDRWPDLSVLQAAHAAELILKARIAQEHPLLIFEQLPKDGSSVDGMLSLDELSRNGRTVQWTDIPGRLWATTGERIPCQPAFDAFGKLRNSIQHFGASSLHDASGETLRFIFRVLDPFLHKRWGLYAIDYDEDHEPYIYFVHALVAREIPFLVSVEAAECIDDWDVDWDKTSDVYRELMLSRVAEALK